MYIPSRFNDVRVEGSTVVAIDKSTGETIAAHHINFGSPATLEKNLKRTNASGSRYIGTIGGKGGNSPGYIHAHIEIFRSHDAKVAAFNWKYGNRNAGYAPEWASLPQERRKALFGDFRCISLAYGN